MGPIIYFTAALLFGCPASYGGETAPPLSGPAAAVPAASTAPAAGVIPAELENGEQFCARIEELLPAPAGSPGRKPVKAGLSRAGKEREKAALGREASAVKLCGAAKAQREKIAGLRAAIDKAPEAPENNAPRAVSENLGRLAELLEKNALALFLEAKALRAGNPRTAD